MKRISIILLACVVFSCGRTGKEVSFTVKNSLPLKRNEVVTISAAHLAAFTDEEKKSVKVLDENGAPLEQQFVDSNGDSISDELLFEAIFDSGQQRSFKLAVTDKIPAATEQRTFGRFVPERIDDFAWENELVAFRTYGPEAQRLVDEHEKGGTLSSGLDCWLKRVSYPVIDKWYKKNTDGGSYHKDDGEGYDPYHVGASRGCGGIGVWVHDSLFVSKNFTTYRVLANGPLRTTFELTYAPWAADGKTVNEKKTISIDKGNQLYKVTVHIDSADALPNCTIGITLHEKTGATKADSTKAWFRYWETIDDSEIGTGVVIDPEYVIGHLDYRTTKKDLSQLYVITKPQQNQVIYYTGFAWKKAGILTTPEAWDQYLTDFSARIASPLEPVFAK
ncbi:MAG TPA: DUF4861 domain-containing protein [Ohtaekwangia sp.]|uniref:DUF4861 domain-containing protein n=1 Tax=Ohtaekwangia sp. TaxID=2066019 RepID=UPI002F93564D